MKVLLIDDEEEIRELVSLCLSDYELVEAASGEEGIEQALEEDPDLILLDMLMPGMDGEATLGALKADRLLNAIPVIFLTGIDAPEEEKRLMAAGARGLLRKPIDVRTFADDLRAVLSGSRAKAKVERSAQVLDPDVVDSLRELGGGDEGFVTELLREYVEDTAVRLEVLSQAAAKGDALRVRQEAHSLKSSSGNVGATAVASICAELERAAQAGDVPSLTPLATRLRERFEEAREAIEARW